MTPSQRSYTSSSTCISIFILSPKQVNLLFLRSLPVVFCTDTVVEPLAVVIEVCDTLIADGTVLGLRADRDFTDVAKLVLDDMLVLTPVKDTRLTLTGRVLADHGRVRWVTTDAEHVCHHVTQKDESIDAASDPHHLWCRQVRQHEDEEGNREKRNEEPGE